MKTNNVHNEYLEQAEQFLKDCNAKLTITYIGMEANENWSDTQIRPKYRFTITTPYGRMTEFFWDSIANKEKLARGEYDGPDAYDILSCLHPYDDFGLFVSFEDFCRNFGYDCEMRREALRAKNIYRAVKKETNSLRRIFTEDQLEKLAEIN